MFNIHKTYVADLVVWVPKKHSDELVSLSTFDDQNVLFYSNRQLDSYIPYSFLKHS